MYVGFVNMPPCHFDLSWSCWRWTRCFSIQMRDWLAKWSYAYCCECEKNCRYTSVCIPYALLCLYVRTYAYACVWGVNLFRGRLCGWVEKSSFEKIWGAIGEFLRHRAPINHFFNQPETASQLRSWQTQIHTDRHTFLQCRRGRGSRGKRKKRVKKKKAAGWRSVKASRSGLNEAAKAEIKVEWLCMKERREVECRRHSSPKLAESAMSRAVPRW